MNFILGLITFSVLFLVPKNGAALLPAPFPVPHDGGYIYIDARGQKVGEHIFLEAHYFSEGRAIVRTKMGYGYINSSGSIAIEGPYEWVSDFQDGRAIVYLNQQPQFINNKGERLFKDNYFEIEPFSNGRAIVGTKSGKYGAINETGKLVIDTVFSEIDTFESSVTRASGWKDADSKRSLITIIDTNGTVIVPYELDYAISSFSNNFFKARIPNPDTTSGEAMAHAILNKQGKVMFSIPFGTNMGIDKILPNKLVQISFYKTFWDSENKTFIPTSDYSDGLMDIQGNIILCDSTISVIGDFSDNRAFIKTHDWEYTLVDENFKVIPTGTITRVDSRGFTDGYTKVTMDNEPVMIDLDGQIVPNEYTNVIERLNKTIIYKKKRENTDEFYYGLGKIGEIYTEAIFDDYQVINAHADLVAVIQTVDEKRYYKVYWQSQIVWDEEYVAPLDGQKINSPYMTRANFFASSESAGNDLGGFGRSDNTPKSKGAFKSKENEMNIIFDFDKEIRYGRHQGFKIIVHNGFDQKVYFGAQDSRIDMLMQAKDKNGEWKDIQVMPQSWCGNSYHTLQLKSDEYWEFTAPIFEGSFKTECRVKLIYQTKKSYDTAVTAFSKSFKMSINPGQFWNQQVYRPQGIMDPYR